jgi:hypothetical protein
MSDKIASEEFLLIKNRLERIAALLVRLDNPSIVEVGFMIGCLHNICEQNAITFQDNAK